MKKLTAYITGFVLSVVLTILPAVLLWMHEAAHHAFPTHEVMYAAFVLFAILQLCVQLSFFLHMDEEARPRLNLMALCFALLIVGIVVGGTLWIMENLSHMQHGSQVPFIGGTITPQESND
jgi:cytochrome o ubiquinol oxidase operon protein cyoD